MAKDLLKQVAAIRSEVGDLILADVKENQDIMDEALKAYDKLVNMEVQANYAKNTNAI